MVIVKKGHEDAREALIGWIADNAGSDLNSSSSAFMNSLDAMLPLEKGRSVEFVGTGTRLTLSDRGFQAYSFVERDRLVREFSRVLTSFIEERGYRRIFRLTHRLLFVGGDEAVVEAKVGWAKRAIQTDINWHERSTIIKPRLPDEGRNQNPIPADESELAEPIQRIAEITGIPGPLHANFSQAIVEAIDSFRTHQAERLLRKIFGEPTIKQDQRHSADAGQTTSSEVELESFEEQVDALFSVSGLEASLRDEFARAVSRVRGDLSEHQRQDDAGTDASLNAVSGKLRRASVDSARASIPIHRPPAYEGKTKSGEIYRFLETAYPHRADGPALTTAYLRANDPQALKAFYNRRRTAAVPPALAGLIDAERGHRDEAILADHNVDLETPDGTQRAKRLMSALGHALYRTNEI